MTFTQCQGCAPPACIVTGWKLVPIEPTREMIVAAKAAFVSAGPIAFADFYAAMIVAAPPPPTGET